MQQHDFRAAATIGDLIDNIGSSSHGTSSLPKQGTQEKYQAVLARGIDGRQRQGVERIVVIQPWVQLQTRETLSRELPDGCRHAMRIGHFARIDRADRNESVRMASRALRHHVVVDVVSDRYQACTVWLDKVHLREESIQTRIVAPRPQPTAVTRYMDQRVEKVKHDQ